MSRQQSTKKSCAEYSQNSNLRKRATLLLTTVLLLIYLPGSNANVVCSFNGNGNCTVSSETDEISDLLSENNSSVIWKIRPQNIGFMYYLRTTDDGDDLSVRGIVKWKVQLKNWTPNDTVVEGFLVTILDHDTNETVNSYEISISESFETFVESNDVLELRMQLDDVLKFDRRYDAKINILPIGKQAPASSFLSIMGKLEGEKCSAMTGLAERWAPHVMVDVFQSTSEVEIAWLPAPPFLCVKTYEIILQNRDGVILNTTEVEVTPGNHFVNASFGSVGKNQTVQVKVRGKNAIDGGCACVNCNCITDKTKFFTIPEHKKPKVIAPTTPGSHEDTDDNISGTSIFLIAISIGFIVFAISCGCLFCRRNQQKILRRKKTALNVVEASSSQFPDRKSKTKKQIFKILLICPDVEGNDCDYMMRIVEALKKSNHKVACDKWRDNTAEAEENMLRWVYEQTQKADKIIIFHSKNHLPRCGVYELVDNFFPCTDQKLAHVALTPDARRGLPQEVEYVLPRDQKLFEEAYDFEISQPLVIDIPTNDHDMELVYLRNSCDSIVEDSPNNTKDHSTDSGVSSMSSNSSDSAEPTRSQIDVCLKNMNIESHPLLRQAIEV